MKRKHVRTVVGILLVLFLFLTATSSWADPVVKQIYYQKKTTLPPKTFDFTLSLWDAETGGVEVWSEEKELTLTGGILKT